MSKKPTKPYKDFPLYAHSNGQWAKKIRGATRCFGKWDDWRAALEKYLDCKDDLQAGRRPRRLDDVSIADLANEFIESKRRLVETSELSKRTYRDYDTTCRFIVDNLGATTAVQSLRPLDFSKLRSRAFEGRGHVSAGNKIRMVRIIFKWGFDSKLYPHPVEFGPDFKMPTKLALRREKLAREKKEFSAKEIRMLILHTNHPVRAMIMLGINCGFGNGDCGRLQFDHLDLNDGWVNFPRPKTGVDRRSKLWPETVRCLRIAISSRPKDRREETKPFVFLTRHGELWYRETADSPISNEVAKVLSRLRIKRRHVNFYALRHTFETVAGEVCDPVAVNHVMGHVDDSMAAIYTTTIFSSRLEAISEHVRRWLFPVTTRDTLEKI